MGMKTMTIDGERLQKAILKRGLMITHVAEEMGRGSTYITDCVRRNTIPTHAFVTLNKMYNITEDEIKPLPKKEVVRESKAKPESVGIEAKLDKIIELLEAVLKGSVKTVELLETVVKGSVETAQNTLYSADKIEQIDDKVNKMGNIQMQNLDYVLAIKKELCK